MAAASNKILMVILSILLAPLAVFLMKGAGKDLIINIILCFLGYLPAIIHSLWLSISFRCSYQKSTNTVHLYINCTIMPLL